MLKRIAAFLIMLMLLPLPALGAAPPTPRPIVPLTEDQIPQLPDGVRFYLVMCSDRNESSAKAPGNTDGIMLIGLDPKGNRIMLVSIVRDLLVMRPDGQPGRINGIARRFSLEDTMHIISTHFGIPIENYVLVNWKGVADIIDTLGGVELTLTNGEVIRLRDKLAYKNDWATPELDRGGTYRLRGYAAVTYMRIRSDVPVGGELYYYRRTTRARTVVASLFDSLRGISWQQALQLATHDIWESIAATDMTLADIMAAAGYAFTLRSAPIEQFRLPINGTGEELIYMNMSTQQIEYEPNRQALQEFIRDGYTIREEDDEGWD